MFTRSAIESAFIFCITLPRCAFMAFRIVGRLARGIKNHCRILRTCTSPSAVSSQRRLQCQKRSALERRTLFSVTTDDALKDLYLLIGEDKVVAVTGNRDLIVLE